MILPGDHGEVTYLRVTRGWRAKMKYKTPWNAEPKTVSAEGSTKGKAKRRLLEDKWKAIKDSWVQGSTIGQSLTVADLLDRWFPTVAERRGYGKQLSPNTLQGYQDIINHHILPRIGDLHLPELTAHRLEDAIRDMIDEKGIGKSNARHSLTVLKKALKFARKNEWMLKNPIEDIDTDGLYIKSRDPEALTIEEVEQVRRALYTWAAPSGRRSGPTSEYVSDVFEVLVGTGCRIGEALGLHWEDLHLEDPVPWVRIHKSAKEPRKRGKPWIDKTKSEDTRDLALPAFLVDVLKVRRENHLDSPLVFQTRNGEIVRRQSVARAMKTAMQRESVEKQLREKVTHHAMRRTVATLLGPERAKEQLGHRHMSITENHYIDRSLYQTDFAEPLQELGVGSRSLSEPEKPTAAENE